jgi:tetratricopeptide (TPR) repeat protein
MSISSKRLRCYVFALLTTWLCLPILSFAKDLTAEAAEAEAFISQRYVLTENKWKQDAVFAEKFIKRFNDSADPAVQALLAYALIEKGLRFEKQGKNEAALATYSEIINRFADTLGARYVDWRLSHPFAVTHIYKGDLQRKMKQTQEAIATYGAVIKKFGRSDELILMESVTDALLGKAELLAEMGKTVEARASFKQVEERVGTSIAVIDVKRLVKAQRYLAIPEVDAWSGRYRMETGSKDNAQPIEKAVYEISKLPDLREKDVTGRYQSDLARWRMSLDVDGKKESTSIRRFLANDDLNEYEQFGWKGLYMQNKIECMDAGHFFFCKTEPNTKVTFSDKEFYVTKSGIFGILLHAGVFELYRLAN